MKAIYVVVEVCSSTHCTIIFRNMVVFAALATNQINYSGFPPGAIEMAILGFDGRIGRESVVKMIGCNRWFITNFGRLTCKAG